MAKFFFACILIALALWAIASQVGADKFIDQQIRTGKAAAEWRK